ncbi:MAG: Xaa-Pro peptidase family protein [Clostridiales bacterium]
MKKYIAGRIAALQQKLAQLKLDAALIYDRENLIYFAGAADLEGGVLCVPAQGEAEIFCLWVEAAYMRQSTGLKVIGYPFPAETQSTMAAKWLAGLGLSAPRVGFTRYFISLKDYQCLRGAIPGMVVGDIAIPCYQLRSVKVPEEIDRIRQASKALTAGMDAAVATVKAGIPEYEVLAEAEYAMGKAGSQGSSFRMQVLAHSRQMNIHPYAGKALLEDNAPVVIHLGATVEGYGAKMCRTVFLGNPPEECVRIYQVLKKVQDAAVAALMPGVTCAEVYDAAAEVIRQEGYERQWLMEHIGYGVGIRQSEFYPIISKDSPVVLEENMVVDLLLPTIYKPGLGGPRITDTILMTDQGPRYLTEYNREVIMK